MKTRDFNFNLPENLIAQEPPKERGQSRLMTLDRSSGQRAHSSVTQLPCILSEDRFLSPLGEKPLLVFNDTKVRKARLNGISLKSGANAEFLLLEKNKNEEWKALVQRSSRRKVGSRYVFYDKDKNEIASAEITKEEGEFKFIRFDRTIDESFFDKYGSVPLPPYIKRKDNPSDAERYQTVYARETSLQEARGTTLQEARGTSLQEAGSVAAPTAGLHFTRELLDELNRAGIESVFITLHVGLGTFLPVRAENIEDHVMHKESFFINEQSASLIENAMSANRKIIAVGTTSLRALESAVCEEQLTKGLLRLKRGEQGTSIFIYPGYDFKAADALFTNFHTPQSTLLMLVSAFAGRELILEIYEEAIREQYRFFSYGDAMLIY